MILKSSINNFLTLIFFTQEKETYFSLVQAHLDLHAVVDRDSNHGCYLPFFFLLLFYSEVRLVLFDSMDFHFVTILQMFFQRFLSFTQES